MKIANRFINISSVSFVDRIEHTIVPYCYKGRWVPAPTKHRDIYSFNIIVDSQVVALEFDTSKKAKTAHKKIVDACMEHNS